MRKLVIALSILLCSNCQALNWENILPQKVKLFYDNCEAEIELPETINRFCTIVDILENETDFSKKEILKVNLSIEYNILKKFLEDEIKNFKNHYEKPNNTEFSQMVFMANLEFNNQLLETITLVYTLFSQ